MARKIDYANLNADDLQYLADRQWLIAEGDYQGFETSKQVAAFHADGSVPEGSEGEDDGIEYKDARVADLKAELESRGLPTDGKKEELIARLEADDEEEDEEDDDEEEDPDA